MVIWVNLARHLLFFSRYEETRREWKLEKGAAVSWGQRQITAEETTVWVQQFIPSPAFP